MSEGEFLTRWSRRKREAAQDAGQAKPAKTDRLPAATDAPSTAVATAPQHAEPAFDPASLPPIESITALTDISAFLRAGVPAELTRAALRRAWSADPAIRDFVGLAENAWDFTDPGAMPGFGPLEATDDVRRMVADIVERMGQRSEPPSPGTAAAVDKTASDSNSMVDAVVDETDASLGNSAATDDELAPSSAVSPQGNAANVAVQRAHRGISQEQISSTDQQALPRRQHGGALPR